LVKRRRYEPENLSFCVDVSPAPTIPGGWTDKSPAVAVTVPNGGSATAYFFYWYQLR
jgi:hypothetical protein